MSRSNRQEEYYKGYQRRFEAESSKYQQRWDENEKKDHLLWATMCHDVELTDRKDVRTRYGPRADVGHDIRINSLEDRDQLIENSLSHHYGNYQYMTDRIHDPNSALQRQLEAQNDPRTRQWPPQIQNQAPNGGYVPQQQQQQQGQPSGSYYGNASGNAYGNPYGNNGSYSQGSYNQAPYSNQGSYNQAPYNNNQGSYNSQNPYNNQGAYGQASSSSRNGYGGGGSYNQGSSSSSSSRYRR